MKLRRMVRAIGSVLMVAGAAVGLFGVCCVDGVPDEYLNQFLMLLVGQVGVFFGGAFIRSLGDE